MKTVDISKDNFIALGCYDQCIRILDSSTGKLFKKQQTGSLIPDGHSAVSF